MTAQVEWIWHDGEIKPYMKAQTHVMTHALHYGTSVFEGIRCYASHLGPVIFRLRAHTRRMYKLGQDLPAEDSVHAGGSERRLQRGHRPQPAIRRRLYTADRIPRRRRPEDSAFGKRTGSRGRCRLAMGLVPRRNGRGRGRLLHVLATGGAEYRTGARQGRRQLPVERSGYAGSPGKRLRRGGSP